MSGLTFNRREALIGGAAALGAPLLGAPAARADTSQWLRRQQELAVTSGNAGISFNTVNGYTEGYNIFPTEEDGETISRWAHETVAAHRRHWL